MAAETAPVMQNFCDQNDVQATLNMLKHLKDSELER